MAFSYRTILCPIDVDDNSVRALDNAIEIARHLAGAMAMVRVVPLIAQFYVSIPYDM